jgi:hypothetical protein
MHLATLTTTVPDGVIRSDELRAAGVSNYAVSARCRPSGPWQRVLPGVVLLSAGAPTRRQRLRAGLAYAGAGSVLTGSDALVAQGIQVPCPPEVLVLVPAARRTVSQSYLTVERTTRLPRAHRCDGLPVAPIPRATIDAARRERNLDRLHNLLLTPLEVRACTLADLLAELAAGNQRGTAAPRALLTKLKANPPGGLAHAA